MHCHLHQCILHVDVGPIYSFWCFSFERYNGLLEKMNKSWKSPEVQFMRKFVNLQDLQHMKISEFVDEDLLSATEFMDSMKSPEEPLPTPDGMLITNSEISLFCLPTSMNGLLNSNQCPILPGREKFFYIHG